VFQAHFFVEIGQGNFGSSGVLAAPDRHIIKPLPYRLDPLAIMRPPRQGLKTRKLLLPDQAHLEFFQNDSFLDLRQTIRLRQAPTLKKARSLCSAYSDHPLAQRGVSGLYESALKLGRFEAFSLSRPPELDEV